MKPVAGGCNVEQPVSEEPGSLPRHLREGSVRDPPGVLAVIQWGPEVRLFAHSGLLGQLAAEGCRVTVAAKIVDEDLRRQMPAGVELLPLCKERPIRLRTWVGNLLDRAHRDRHARGAGAGSSPRRGRVPALLAHGITSQAARRESLFQALLAVERRLRRVEGEPECRRVLADTGASVLLVSDLQGYPMDGLLASAAARGISSVALVNSWRDISPQMRLRAEHSFIGVWHENIRERALRLQPWLNPSRLLVMGCAHYDPLARPEYVMPRDELFRQLELPVGARFVLFTGANPSRIPGDAYYIRLLVEAIAAAELPDDLFIVVRPNPQDTTGELSRAVCTWGHRVKLSIPDWRWEPERDWNYARRADLVTYASLLHHASLNLSVASTVTVECAITDLPVVNPLFSATGAVTGRTSAREEWKAEFYRPVRETGAAQAVQDERELIRAVAGWLAEPGRGRPQRARLVREQLGVPPGLAAHVACDLVRSCRSPWGQPPGVLRESSVDRGGAFHRQTGAAHSIGRGGSRSLPR